MLDGTLARRLTIWRETSSSAACHRPDNEERLCAVRHGLGERRIGRDMRPVVLQREKRTKALRCWVMGSRIVPLSIGNLASRAQSKVRCVTGPATSKATSRPAPASSRRWVGSTTRTVTRSAPRQRGRGEIVHYRGPAVARIGGCVDLAPGRAEVDPAGLE